MTRREAATLNPLLGFGLPAVLAFRATHTAGRRGRSRVARFLGTFLFFPLGLLVGQAANT